MRSHVRILGIAGSLRRGSYNQAALRAAELLVPENGEIDLFQLDEIPMFNEGDEKRPPSSVVKLKKRIAAPMPLGTRKASPARSSVATLTGLSAAMQMPILQPSSSVLMRRMERQKSRLFAGKRRATS